jgi:hypothetical protein
MTFEIQAIFYLPLKISANTIYSGVHWGTRKKHKEQFRSVNFVCQKVKKFPVCIDYNFYFKRNCLDTTNTFYMVKLIEDCMVAKKVLPDDSPKYVSKTSVRSLKGDDDYCEILIYPDLSHKQT